MNAGVVSLAAIKIACASEVCRQTEVPFGRALDLVQLHFPKGSSDVPGSFAEVDLARDNGLLAPEIYKQVMAVFLQADEVTEVCPPGVAVGPSKQHCRSAGLGPRSEGR